MTHEERFAKASAAVQAALPDENCAVMLIIVSPKGFSVMSNLPDDGKIALLKDVIHSFKHNQMERETPKNIQ